MIEKKAAKNAFSSLRTKCVRCKKALKNSKRSDIDAEKGEKDMGKDMLEYLLFGCMKEATVVTNPQNNQEDIEASEPVDENSSFSSFELFCGNVV